jgi:hypothetical protein
MVDDVKMVLRNTLATPGPVDTNACSRRSTRARLAGVVRPFALAVSAAAAVALSGCATPATRVDAQWVSPDVAGQRAIRSVVVVAAIPDATHRRLFEDRMVAMLADAGVAAMPSYRVMSTDAPVGEDQLRRVLADARADHALVSRVVNVTTEVHVTPGMVMGPTWGPGWGRGSPWGPGWGGFAGYYNTMWATSVPPQVTTTQNVHADTRVFDAKAAAVVWSAATTTSTGWNSVPQLIDQFVRLIVDSMKKDGVI